MTSRCFHGSQSSCITANRLACYVPALRECDDTFRLRIVLHGFGTVWRDSDSAEELRSPPRSL